MEKQKAFFQRKRRNASNQSLQPTSLDILNLTIQIAPPVESSTQSHASHDLRNISNQTVDRLVIDRESTAPVSSIQYMKHASSDFDHSSSQPWRDFLRINDSTTGSFGLQDDFPDTPKRSPIQSVYGPQSRREISDKLSFITPFGAKNNLDGTSINNFQASTTDSCQGRVSEAAFLQQEWKSIQIKEMDGLKLQLATIKEALAIQNFEITHLKQQVDHFKRGSLPMKARATTEQESNAKDLKARQTDLMKLSPNSSLIVEKKQVQSSQTPPLPQTRLAIQSGNDESIRPMGNPVQEKSKPPQDFAKDTSLSNQKNQTLDSFKTTGPSPLKPLVCRRPLVEPEEEDDYWSSIIEPGQRSNSFQDVVVEDDGLQSILISSCISTVSAG